jgi:hypothetical protein
MLRGSQEEDRKSHIRRGDIDASEKPGDLDILDADAHLYRDLCRVGKTEAVSADMC